MQEPVFVAAPGAAAEDEGWVLALIFEPGAWRTSLAIFDAADVAAGPVATIRLPAGATLPPGLHGSWTPEVVVPAAAGAPGGGAPAPRRDIRAGALA